MDFIIGFVSSVLFWLNLDRKNVASETCISKSGAFHIRYFSNNVPGEPSLIPMSSPLPLPISGVQSPTEQCKDSPGSSGCGGCYEEIQQLCIQFESRKIQ